MEIGSLKSTPLEKFIRRARRLAEHSIIKDSEQLQEISKVNITLLHSIESGNSLTRPVPENEEAFESLVARLRPFLLKSESVYVPKVLEQLDKLVSEEEQPIVEEWKQKWQSVQPPDYKIQRYGMQITEVSGSTDSGLVSDTALADGWLYADLVHTDPFGPKAKALYFSLEERYLAAVSVFSNVAIYILNLLEYIKRLSKKFDLKINLEAWDSAVVVGNTPRKYENFQIYTAELNTEFPDLKSDINSHPDWTLFSPLRLQKPIVYVRFMDPHERLLKEIQASGARYLEEPDNKSLFLIELEGVLSLKIPVEKLETSENNTEVNFQGAYENNHQLRIFLELKQIFLETSKIEIKTTGLHVQLNTPYLTSIEESNVSHWLEVLQDINIVEQQMDVILPLLTENEYLLKDIKLIRILALMYSGNVLPSSQNKIMTLLEGSEENPIYMKSAKRQIAGCEVTTPILAFWHPNQIVTPISEDTATQKLVCSVEVPENETFYMWMPHVIHPQLTSDLKPISEIELGYAKM